ncbi:hypothetical protein BpHYR1_003515, partial [Brachionus plicatilis]
MYLILKKIVAKNNGKMKNKNLREIVREEWEKFK